MILSELECYITQALKDCQDVIDKHPHVIFSEADLERLLSSKISFRIHEDIETEPGQDDFSVHTQVSHYFEEDGKDEIDSRVDILILKESELRGKINHKEFEYRGDSFSIELKYLHKNDSIQRVQGDFNKWYFLKKESWMYVVVLIDDANDATFNNKTEKFESMYNNANKDDSNTTNKLFHYVLRKKI